MATDVIVVGAGPAGCSLANLLAKAGLQVTVFESLPDEKSYFCGELIYVRDAEQATGLKFGKDLIFNRYRKARLVFADTGKEVSIPFQAQHKFCLVDTELMKTKLRESAESHGAKFYFSKRISSVIKKRGKVFGVESGESLFSKVVVGCDGSNSTVARTAGFDRSNYKTMPAFRWKFKKCKGLDTKSADFYLYEKLGLGYLWVYPSAKDRCNVGIGGINPKHMHEIFDEFVKTQPFLKNTDVYYRGAEMVPYTGLLPKISMPGCILIGESAGQVHVMTGGGVNSSLDAAKMAAEVIISAIEEDSYDRDGLDEYDFLYRKSEEGMGISRETRGLSKGIELQKRKNVVALLGRAVDLLEPGIIKKAAIGQLTTLDVIGAFFKHPAAFAKLAIEALT